MSNLEVVEWKTGTNRRTFGNTCRDRAMLLLFPLPEVVRSPHRDALAPIVTTLVVPR
jgi:hypothetical protein